MATDLQVAALTEMMRTVNAGDAVGYARVYDPNARITIPGGGLLTGRPAIEQYEAELLREYPGTRLAFYTAWQKGSTAVVHYGVNGKTPAGRAMGHEGLLFFQFTQAGLIQEERRYLDSVTPMAQLGAFGLTNARPLPALPAKMAVSAAPGEPNAVTLVRNLVDAMNRKDQAGFLSALRDETVIDELMWLEPFVGNVGARGWFETWTSAVPDAKTEITNLIAVGDAVLVEAVVRGTLNGALGTVSAPGVPFSVHRGLVFEVRGGKLARMSAFTNGKELAQAVGQWPPRAR